MKFYKDLIWFGWGNLRDSPSQGDTCSWAFSLIWCRLVKPWEFHTLSLSLTFKKDTVTITTYPNPHIKHVFKQTRPFVKNVTLWPENDCAIRPFDIQRPCVVNNWNQGSNRWHNSGICVLVRNGFGSCLNFCSSEKWRFILHKDGRNIYHCEQGFRHAPRNYNKYANSILIPYTRKTFGHLPNKHILLVLKNRCFYPTRSHWSTYSKAGVFSPKEWKWCHPGVFHGTMSPQNHEQ